jgi:hypothetical protein
MTLIVRELRVVPLFVGLACILLANRLYAIDQTFNDHDFYPALWPWWMLAAGVACLWYAAVPADRWAMALSGSLASSAMFARAVALALDLIDGGSVLARPQVHVAGIVYTLTAGLIAVVWVRVMRPASTLLRRRR